MMKKTFNVYFIFSVSPHGYLRENSTSDSGVRVGVKIIEKSRNND